MVLGTSDRIQSSWSLENRANFGPNFLGQNSVSVLKDWPGLPNPPRILENLLGSAGGALRALWNLVHSRKHAEEPAHKSPKVLQNFGSQAQLSDPASSSPNFKSFFSGRARVFLPLPNFGSVAAVLPCITSDFGPPPPAPKNLPNLTSFSGNIGKGPKIGVVETVVLENGVFVPYRKQVVLTKIGENSDIAFDPQKQGILLLEPPEINENDENGGCHPGKMTVCHKHCFDNPEKEKHQN